MRDQHLAPRRSSGALAGLLTGLLAGCDGGDVTAADPIDDNGPPMALLHEEEQLDSVFADVSQYPIEKSARLHSCGKLPYESLGPILASRGVDMTSTVERSAGLLYRTGRQTLGAPTYAARSREPLRNTTGGVVRLYDILIAAAPELIDNLPRRPECMDGAVAARLFNDAGGCDEGGFACLMGYPPPPEMLALCDDMVGRFPAAERQTGQRLAVAAMAATAFLCD